MDEMRKLIFLAFLTPTISALFNAQLATEFCQSKNLNTGTIFQCSHKKSHVEIAKKFAQLGKKFLLININDKNVNFEQILYRKYIHFAIIVDATCQDYLKLFHQDKKFFYETYHWLILTRMNFTLADLKIAPLNINSDVTVAVLDVENNWSIFDVYNPAFQHSGNFVVTKFGNYNVEENCFKRNEHKNKYWLRKNMTGVQFKSAVVIPEPDVEIEDYLISQENREMNSMHRFQSVTVGYCRDMFNFSLDVQRTDSWGYLQENGHFDGLVGLLERRLVDFGSSPLIYKLDRMPVLDYSYGNWILKSTFIYRRPKVLESSHEIFLRPLATNVWLFIVFMMTIITVLLRVIFNRERRILGRSPDAVDCSWSFLILFTLGAFCQQGATCYPKLLSSRTVSIFVFLFCILIYQFYSASIVSYLLMDPPRRINNLKDLTDSSLQAGIEDILIDRNYFVQTTDPAAIELFSQKIRGDSNDSGFYEPEIGLKLVKDGGFAFHVETSTAYPIIEKTFTNQEICELEEVQMYRTQPMHTNLQKHSPFREMMNYCMLQLVEKGEMYRLRKYWDARKPACIESEKKVEIHVGIHEFSAGPIVLSYGILLSSLFLFIEFVLYNKEHILGHIYYILNIKNRIPYIA